MLSASVVASMPLSDVPDHAQLHAENETLRRQVLDLSAAVARLKETSDMYRMVADTAADAILCADEHLEVIYANPSAGELLQRAPARLVGKSLEKILIESDYHRLQTDFQQRTASGQSPLRWSDVELTVRTADEELIPVDVSFGAVRSPDGNYRVSLFMRDARPRKKLEEESRERQSALAHANRLKSVGELAAGLAHELNQPLSAVCLHADLTSNQLPETGVPAEVRENLEIIASQAERAAGIIAVLREMIRKNEPRQQPLDVNEAVHAVIRLLRSEIESRKIQLELNLASHLPQVSADRTQIEQILLNLLQNAAEAIPAAPETKRRRICLETRVEDGFVVADVCDTGPGLPADDPQRVFENFYTTKSSGLGIGLGICRSIATLHRGQMLTRNNADGGACFSLLLPAREEQN